MDIKWSRIRTDPWTIDYLCSAGSLARSGARRGRVNRHTIPRLRKECRRMCPHDVGCRRYHGYRIRWHLLQRTNILYCSTVLINLLVGWTTYSATDKSITVLLTIYEIGQSFPAFFIILWKLLTNQIRKRSERSLVNSVILNCTPWVSWNWLGTHSAHSTR